MVFPVGEKRVAGREVGNDVFQRSNWTACPYAGIEGLAGICGAPAHAAGAASAAAMPAAAGSWFARSMSFAGVGVRNEALPGLHGPLVQPPRFGVRPHVVAL